MSRSSGVAHGSGRSQRPLAIASFFRHQAGALVATLVDFGTMSLLVLGLGASAVLGTVVGATVGGVTNFFLGRRWIFGTTGDAAVHQAGRYVAISGASLGWNALGEYLLHDRLGLQFQIARVIVSVVVSVAWNYPLHRFFVFAHPRHPKLENRPPALSLP